VLGISTSGASANVNRALKRARELGLLTVGFAGRDGGRMPEACDHSFVVRSWAIHRIQESHTLLLHLLWDQIHVALGEDDVL
jgi:D-sedoheptulose 7-phosphate isomerase